MNKNRSNGILTVSDLANMISMSINKIYQLHLEDKSRSSEDLLTISDVAEMIRISISTIDRLQAEGKFPLADYTIGDKRIRLWRRSTVQDWLDQTQKNPRKII